MTPPTAEQLALARATTRRYFLGQARVGVGAMALASLLSREGRPEGGPGSGGVIDAPAPGSNPMAPRAPHFAPRAKSVIFLHMAGSPPQQELFDYKPALIQHNDKPCPEEYLKGERFAFIKGTPKLLGTPYKFAPRGRCGTMVSELLPRLGERVDDIAVVKSMQTDFFNHAPAQLFLYTGTSRFGSPSMGAWVTYGLGSECDDLPGFVVLVSYGKTPDAGKSVWGSGFLPSIYQGVQCRTSGEPVLYVSDPRGMGRASRRRSLDALRDLNQMHHERSLDPETLTRIEQYELAFRMQAAVPEAMDIAREPAAARELYGAEPGATSFANNCLLARRLIERGVRFVQLFDWGWDAHGTGPHDDIVTQLPKKCRETDQALAALLTDLKQRGLLEETLVVWSGEFGRTPMNERRGGSTYLGRDHHPHAFTIWMAGGGVKGGITHGETDDLGYHAVERPVHVHDLQATILHLLGFDHHRLTHRYLGLDQRLTSVTREAHVVSELLG